MSNAKIVSRTAPRTAHTAAAVTAAYAANDLAKIAAAATVARAVTGGKGGKGGKVATPKTDYHGAGHNGVDTFTFRSLTIVRARLDKRQNEVTVTVAGEVVFTDTRGSKAVTAAQTLISTLVTLKNERTRLITAKNGKISALTVADINERLVNLDARCKVALTTAKFAGIDPAWLAVVTPAKMSA